MSAEQHSAEISESLWLRHVVRLRPHIHFACLPISFVFFTIIPSLLAPPAPFPQTPYHEVSKATSPIIRPYRRVDEHAVVPKLRVIRRRKKCSVAALLARSLLDRLSIRPAAVNVHVKGPAKTVLVVRQEVDQSVVSLRPKALTDEIRASGSTLRGQRQDGK